MTNVERVKHLGRKYHNLKSELNDVKSFYHNENPINIASNELCIGLHANLYDELITNSYISMSDIENLFLDFKNCKDPSPQIMLKFKGLKDSVLIVEIDDLNDEILPIDATDRMKLYTVKFSRKYNVLGLAMSIDKNTNCEITNAIYQKNNATNYNQLYLSKTVLTVGEYTDIMSNL